MFNQMYNNTFLVRNIFVVVLLSNPFLVCNYTLEAPAFNFTSPGYPNAYPNGIFCQYRFKIALGQAVKIYFTEFSLESSESCAKDAVSLYENGNLSTVVCGLKSFSNPWMSVGDSVVMRFKSDRSHTSKGFYGYFSFFTYRKCNLYSQKFLFLVDSIVIFLFWLSFHVFINI